MILPLGRKTCPLRGCPSINWPACQPPICSSRSNPSASRPASSDRLPIRKCKTPASRRRFLFEGSAFQSADMFLGVEFDGAANEAGALALHPAGARVAVWTVAAEEERQIALEAMQVRAGGA